MTKKPSIMARAMDVGQSVAINKAPTEPVRHDVDTSGRARTAPGALASFLAKESDVMRENVRLQQELQRWDGAAVTRRLDPATVRHSQYANRDEGSFDSEEFRAFADEIESSGGNVQPVKVRPIPASDPQAYEIVFGHRRHRACLERGQPLLAMIDSIDDRALFQEMDRENRQRADLRPYEQGEMYRKALENKLYPSLRALADALGVQVGNASTAVRIARLPAEVLDAFPSRLEIQFRWGALLDEALAKDRPMVLQAAKDIAAARKEGAQISAKKTLTLLCKSTTSNPGADQNKDANEDAIVIEGRRVASIRRDKRQVSVVLERKSFSGDGLEFVLDAIRQAAAEGVLR